MFFTGYLQITEGFLVAGFAVIQIGSKFREDLSLDIALSLILLLFSLAV